MTVKPFFECADIAEAHAQKETINNVLSTDEMSVILILPNIYLYDYFDEATSGIKKVIKKLLEKNTNWVFSNGTEEGETNKYLFDIVINSEANEDIKARLMLLKDTLIHAANVDVFPYADKQQHDLDAAKLAYSTESLTVKNKVWNKERYVNITLHEDLYEPANVVLFYSDSFLINENLGRAKRLHKAGNYQIDLKGVQKTATLHVHFNINANATVELA